MRGKQARGKLATAMAKRGIFRGGPSAAAEATLLGETEAGVAQARAGFAESAAERRARKQMARQQAFAQVLGGIGGGFM